MDRTEWSDLAGRTGFPRVSIFLPAFAGPRAQQDPIRLHNALRQAEAELTGRGMRRPDAERLLLEARDRVGDMSYWNHVKGGVAVLIEPDETRFVELPDPPAELAWVGDRYYLRPLLTGDMGGSHYVLALHRGSATLYRAKGAALTEEPFDVPRGTDEVRAQYDFDAPLGWHPNASRGRGAAGPAARGGAGDVPQFHALGQSPEDFQDVVLDQYLVAIAKQVDALLAETRPVLVLAGGPREVGWLREKLSGGHIPDAFVSKNPAALALDELGGLAWAIAEPLVNAGRAAALDRLRRSLGNAQVPGSNELAEILGGASAGRVDALFVDPTVQVWGRFDAAAGQIDRASERRPEDEDLLDLAVVEAFRNGAATFALRPEERPRLGPVGAVFRW